MTGRLLVVTAVDAERSAVLAGLADGAVDVAVVGVGAATAAAGTARLLALAGAAGTAYAGVVSAGIGGGFVGRAEIGAVVLGTRSVAADLGADSADGFLPLDVLGFGATALPGDPNLLAALRRALPEARPGEVLTVNTGTGTADRAWRLAARHPAARAEAMEGFGVALAAAGARVPFVELRTVSNAVGPRDRGAWDIPTALDALTRAAAALATDRA